MKTILNLSLALFIVAVSADLVPPVTQVFGSANYHDPLPFNGSSIAGVAVGYAVFGSLLIFAWVRIWVDEY